MIASKRIYISDLIQSIRARLRGIINKLILYIKSDRKFIKVKWKLEFGVTIDIDNPQTFNEKLQWLKLYDRQERYTKMVDKYEAKQYIAAKIGWQYVVPLIGVWESPKQIRWDSLPASFVLKCSHDSGGVIVCKDKKRMDSSKAIKRLSRNYSQNYYLTNREWPYKNVHKRVIAEAYLGDNLQDYRYYCFNGRVQFVYSYTNHSKPDGSKPEPRYCDIFDRNWTPMSFRQNFPPSRCVKRPVEFEKMISLAEILSAGIPFLRVDFFLVDSKIYVGEMTFYPGGGLAPFYPHMWDKILGDMLVIPQKDSEGKRVTFSSQ